MLSKGTAFRRYCSPKKLLTKGTNCSQKELLTKDTASKEYCLQKVLFPKDATSKVFCFLKLLKIKETVHKRYCLQRVQFPKGTVSQDSFSPILQRLLLQKGAFGSPSTTVTNYDRVIGLMSKVFANGLGDWGSIPDRVIPKTQKMVLDSTSSTMMYDSTRSIPGQVIPKTQKMVLDSTSSTMMYDSTRSIPGQVIPKTQKMVHGHKGCKWNKFWWDILEKILKIFFE